MELLSKKWSGDRVGSLVRFNTSALSIEPGAGIDLTLGI